jgi:RNA polymerase sigma factor (sigma-70 family)
MSVAKLNRVVRELGAARETDRQLLTRFARRDPEAFAELVERHGPMVFRVCRRVLRHEQDAEDAFQATFLVLAGRAAAIRNSEAVASWLHGVAHRVALRARRDAVRRRVRERETPMPATKPPPHDWGEIQAALDEEIRRLPAGPRAAFVLCFLEGKSRSEAAAELGVKEGTVWSRLSLAKKLLGQRLGRRGIVLPALLAAVAVADDARCAPRLVHTPSARVAALASGIARTFPVKLSAVLVALAASALLAFGGSPPKPEATPAEAHAQPPVAAPKPEAIDPDDPKAAGKFHGRVHGPDGKPLGGAKVYIVPYYDGPKQLGAVRAETDADGRFAFDAADLTYPAFDGLPARREGIVVAVKDGFAADWFHTWGRNHRGLREYWDPVRGAEVNLHLVKDDVPIRGRFLDPAGKPVAGARVRVTHLAIPSARDLTAHLDRWGKASVMSGFLTRVPSYEKEIWRVELLPGLVPDVRTDADGRFTLNGLGRDRIAEIKVSAPGVIDTRMEVMTRDAPDTRQLFVGGGKDAGYTVHGANFTKSLKAGMSITGRVIDRDTRKPVAGVWVGPLQNAVNTLTQELYPWVTDEQGRFTITGLAPDFRDGSERSRTIVAIGAPGLPYQTAWVEWKGGEVLIECRRGIPFRLKLVDEAGKPVEADVTYTDIQANPSAVRDEVTWPISHAAKKADGVYEGYVLPGPGAVLVDTPRSAGFRPARVDPKAFFAPGRVNWPEAEAKAYGTTDSLTISQGRYIGVTYRGGTLDQSEYEAIVLVNPPAGSDALELTATLVRDKPRVVSIIDGDGKPVVGADVDGRKLRGSSFPLRDLHPDRVRNMTIKKDDRKLVGTLEARGGDTPITVTLRPWATATGRILDDAGKPVVRGGVVFQVKGSATGEQVSGLTDTEGKFRISPFVPGGKYTARFYIGSNHLVPTVPIAEWEAKPGETRDLGDVRTKPILAK